VQTLGPKELLERVIVIRDLPAEQLTLLAAEATLRKTSRGEMLFREGDVAEGFFVLRSGEVKVTKFSRDGREQIFYIARAERPIVEGVRFDGGKYSASAVALRPTSALVVANDSLARLGGTHPRILQAMVDLRARRADRNMALITDLSLRTVPARLASFICTLVALQDPSEDGQVRLVRELTTETVAGRLGTVREEISRGLALLEREGALRATPQVIEVLDVRKLEEIAYGPLKPHAAS
jgi:CRP-like cAMP-binding protein